MFSRVNFFAACVAIVLSAVVGYAQQQPNPDQNQAPETNQRQRPFGPREGRGFRRGPGRDGMFGPEVLRQLNLTEDQQKQIHTIIQQNFESTKTQRDELRQLGEKRSQGTLTAEEEARARTLREQLQSSMKESQSKIAALLTADQKTKLEEIMKERRENRERFGNRHRGGFPTPNQPNPPAQKPTTPNN